MYCAKCGYQNKDNAAFCQSCGNPLRRRSSEPVRMAAGAAGGGVVEALRSLIQSPVYLVAVIAISVQILISIIMAATGYSPFTGIINNILDAADVPSYYYSEIYKYLSALTSTSVISTIISNLPTIVITAGLWILYANSRSSMRNMSTTGLTMVHVIIIIRMIILGIILAIGLIGSIAAVVGINSLYDKSPAGWIVLLLLIFGITGFVVFFYFTRILKMLSSAKDIILIGKKTYPASMFVIVLTFISGVLQCISSFTSIITGGALGFLSNASGAAATIAFGILMLRFNTLEQMTVPSPGMRRRENPPVPSPGYDPDYPPFQRIPGRERPIPVPPAAPAPTSKPAPAHPGTWYADEGTVRLSNGIDTPQAWLVRVATGAETRITKPDFTIGKAYGSVDFCIEGNPVISRRHAQIIMRDGNYYIKDTNSTNHVFVEGKMIPPETPVQICNGMKIRLADEIFLFREEKNEKKPESSPGLFGGAESNSGSDERLQKVSTYLHAPDPDGGINSTEL